MSGLDSGTTIGSYQVVRLIAEGALADVYEVAHRRRGGRFAAKLLRADLGVNQVALDRWRREVELVSALRHPHIVAVHEAGVTGDGRSFVVSDFLAGVTLADRIAEAAPMSIMEVLDIVEAVVGALAAAEAAGVVHRNLTPRNIMLVPFASPGGEAREVVKVLDFGISTVREFRSRSQHDPGLAGAGAYLSPEQARGRLGEVDHRSDQFSLAAITYEMMSGRPAFSADTAALVLVKVARVDPKRLVDLNAGVPEEMAAAVHRGLYKVKEDRFPSSLEFLRALCRPVLGLRPAPRLVLSAEDEEGGEGALRPVGDLAETVEVPAPVFARAVVEEKPAVKVASAAVAPAPGQPMTTGEIVVRPEAGERSAPVIEVVDHSPATQPTRRKTSKTRRSTPARPVSKVPAWVVATPDADEIFAPARRSRRPALGMAALMVAGAAAAGWALYGEGGIIAEPGSLIRSRNAPVSVQAGAPSPLPPVAVERVELPAPPTTPASPATVAPVARPGPVVAPPAAAAAAAAPAATAASSSSSPSASVAVTPAAPKPVRRPAPRPRPPRPPAEEAETPTAVVAPEAPTPPTAPIPPSELLGAPAAASESAPPSVAGEAPGSAPAATPPSDIPSAAPTAPTPPTPPTSGSSSGAAAAEKTPPAAPDDPAPTPPAAIPEPRPSEPPATPAPEPPQVPPAAPPPVPTPAAPASPATPS